MDIVCHDELIETYRLDLSAAVATPLREVATIDWAQLEHGFGGAADDVPALLNALYAPVEQHRLVATGTMMELLCHLGSREASLRDYYEPNSYQRSDPAMTAIHDAMRQDVPLLYPYLRDPDSWIRGCVALALGYYPEYAHETIALLTAALSHEEGSVSHDYMLASIESLQLPT